ncbi:uncharacterized protein BDR25DRAFT_270663 [Lindgomyces ingoldianus]|uniref:Uncharacterized protein n=1 Tax=Lindgomyces ingoldianus TaxID=673940 RepID=A0ACB6QGD1_9PLEO|nr:uncharacterized protein BDR25DRAFT_270663 [Lindgomyces ingoldianus]KAF2465172.1 hypothetical protein BDR25DRAFT_270663 [Lindgomyces ingoldianus]
MDNSEASFYLSQLIGKNLRLHTTDKRIFGGQMKCTDKDRNIILALTYEYRAPSEAEICRTVEAPGEMSAPVSWSSRYVGLVVVPGAHVTRIELEESVFGKSDVAL